MPFLSIHFLECSDGTIGTTSTSLVTNQIQVFSISQLQQKQKLYHQNKKISRCNFTDSCSLIQYKNVSSGLWMDTTLHTCFDVSINTGNFSDAFAELQVWKQIFLISVCP